MIQQFVSENSFRLALIDFRQLLLKAMATSPLNSVSIDLTPLP